MRKTFYLGLIAIMLVAGCAEAEKEQVFSVEDARKTLDFAVVQYRNMMAELPDTLEPRSFQGDTMVYSHIYWWTSGFYPGSLWYLYEHSQDEAFKNEAHKRSMRIEPIKKVTNDHDVGFQLYCSFGNGLRLTGNQAYAEIMLDGANSLATRYNPTIGSIRSWDWTDGRWTYPVIVDNMMNLELLMWAAKTSGSDTLRGISIDHSYTTLKNHYRDDHSSYHVVDYNPETGEVIQKNTAQGFADESAWARGQAWGLYGFTMMHRESGNGEFLDHAINIADFLLNHPNYPEDKIPYWDFNAPDIPDAKRDASASAIMASALLELSTFVEGEKSELYFSTAEKILATLSSETYLAKEGENGNFILMHSVGHLPANSEVDVPLTYADYYFIEALLRYIKLKEA
jgi:unsaturated chondroitin disaccharide hydrolase